MNKTCAFCSSESLTLFEFSKKKYVRCTRCGGVSLVEQFRLSFAEEKERYLKHNNTLENQGYIEYLQKIKTSVFSQIPVHEDKSSIKILDYGCGPSAAFVSLLRKEGFDAYGYDPFFVEASSQEKTLFNFIFCIEVVEHFYNPLKDFTLLSDKMNKNTVLAVKTNIIPETIDDQSFNTFFSAWWYPKDSTHVSFYTKKALLYIADKVGLILDKELTNQLFLFSVKA